jgi:lipopolysaccharide export system permease protein
MLKILDRYIIRKFLTTFFFMIGVIMLLSIVFDIAERLSEFIENEAPLGEVVFDYYVNFILYYGNTFSALIVFIAVIWFTAKMAQETEIIPMLNSGKPFTRIMRPYMIASSFLMLISLVLNHFILPIANEKRLNFEEKFYRNGLVVSDYHAEFPNREFLHYDMYIAEDQMISDLQLEKYNTKNEVIGFLKARNAKYIDSTKQWLLLDYYEKIIYPPNQFKNELGEWETKYKNEKINTGKSKDTIFQFNIEDVATRDNIAEAMTYSELKKYISTERNKGNPDVPTFEVELYQRTSYPFATYVLTIIGVSVSSRKRRGGIGINLAIGFIFVFIYIFAMKVTTVAAIKVGFPPLAAVWIPNIIFGIIAYLLYRIAPK